MATTIKLKNGSGAPLAGDLVQGEPALDLTNKRLYTEDSGGTVIEVGTNPSTLTVDTTTLVVDATNNRVGVGTASPSELLHLKTEGTQLLIEDTSSGNKGSFFAANTATVISSDPDNAVASSILQFQVDGSEHMRIDSSGNVGIGRTPGYRLDVEEASPSNGIVQRIGATGSTGAQIMFFQSGISNWAMGQPAGDDDFAFWSGRTSAAAGTERMRILNNGNVGIGTTSPNALLHVRSSGNGEIEVERVSGALINLQAQSAVGVIGTDSNHDLRFKTNSAVRASITAAGNVGIGTTTPVSLGAGYKNLDIRHTTGGGVTLGDASNIHAYLFSDNNGVTLQSPGSRSIKFTTVSTERMRIDSSGNVGIGTSSPSFALGTGLHIDSSGYTTINLQKGGAGQGHCIDFTDASNAIQYRIGTNFASGGENLLFAYGSTPAVGMTLNSSGNVGIGTTSPSFPLDVSGTAKASLLCVNTSSTTFQVNVSAPSSTTTNLASTSGTSNLRLTNSGGLATVGSTGNELHFTTSTTERMRIDSSGNLLVGTTVTPTYGVMNLKNPSDAARWEVGPNTTGNFVVYNQSAVGVYLTDGGTSWTGTSDERLKENINDIGPVLETIKNYQCVNFSYKANQSKKANSIGFIAQDWENDFPNVIETDDSGYLGIKYTETIPVLLKAIQEQQAMIEELKAEVAALKGA